MINIMVLLVVLCGCTDEAKNNSQTRFLFDTVVTLSVDCDNKTLDGAFRLCEEYEKLFSRTLQGSEIYALNESSGFFEVSPDTLNLLEKALYYCEKTNGEYDISICAVSSIWDFEGATLPDRSQIAEALKNVDYREIQINETAVNLNGKQIDLGSIAKGYIAERLVEYFNEHNVTAGIINLGGNVRVFGNRHYNVGIKNPKDPENNITVVKVKNMSVVTSGTYERFITVDNTTYHHILDTSTGFSKQTDLLSATIIGKNGADCDAISTICILYGLKDAKKFIEETKGYEAVFVDTDGNITYTSGIRKENGVFVL